MMTWLRKHVLFPDEVNKSVYFYLIFLVPLCMYLASYPQWKQLLVVFCLFLFLYSYRQGFFIQNQTQKNLHGQLLIASIITLLTGYASIFFYVGFQFPYWTTVQRVYLKYYKIFMTYLCVSSSVSLIKSWDYIAKDWYWIAFGMIFVILCPWISWESEKNHRLIQSLHRDNERLLAIIKQEERQRIARDLHDTMGQSYSMLALKAELAAKLLDRDLTRARTEINEIAESSRHNLTMVRQIVNNLQERTLASSLIEINKLLTHQDIDLEVKSESITHNWPLRVQDPLAAILQEAITNIIKHSRASRVLVEFQEEASFHVKIHDNGVGFSDQTDKVTGYGLKGIRQRVDQVHRQVSFKNDSGAQIMIDIPKEAPNYD